MKELDELLDVFQKEIAEKDKLSAKVNMSELSLTNMYIYKIRDYFLVYMEKVIRQKHYHDRVSLFWETMFTREDIINATVYYVENNKPKTEPENSKRRKYISIDEFLIAFNQFYEMVLEKKYSNPTLYKSKPFKENLSEEVVEIVEKDGYELIDSEEFPAITTTEYKFIANYYRSKKKMTYKDNDVYIILRLLMLYGISMNEICNLKRKDFDLNKRLIMISNKYCENGGSRISLELPYQLAVDITEHFNARAYDEEDSAFVTRTNERIESNYISTHLSGIADAFINEAKDSEARKRFTAYGLIKFAICNMLDLSMNIPSIVALTGRQTDFIECCRPDSMRNSYTTSHFINAKLHALDVYNELS